jgi:plastocyanin
MKAVTFAMIAMLGLTGCGSGGPATESKKADAGSPPAAAFFKPDAATAGTVTGKVAFTGRKPARKPILMESEEDCRKAHASPPLDESALVNANGTLANVFVYIKSGLEGKTFEPESVAVEFDQKGCMFRPRVFGIRAGQTLRITNSDPVTHNIHPMPEKNREWNQGQPPGSGVIERQFRFPEMMIPVKCNVHAWMRSYAAVMEHPYFAVTGEAGTFEMKNVPRGEYVFEAWHERYPAQTVNVAVAASAAAIANFTFKGE